MLLLTQLSISLSPGFPLDTGCKLYVHKKSEIQKTSWMSYDERLMYVTVDTGYKLNVHKTFNLRPVSSALEFFDFQISGQIPDMRNL